MENHKVANVLVEKLGHKMKARSVLRKIPDKELQLLFELGVDEIERRKQIESEKSEHEERMANAALDLFSGAADKSMKDVFNKVLKNYK